MTDLRFPIPPNTPPSICRGCGKAIFWIVTKRDKRMPVNADGTSHFATCDHADTFRKKKEAK